MVTTVKQQPPFEYYWWIVLIVAIILAGGIALLIYTLNKYFELGLFSRKKNMINKPPRKALIQIKNEYAQKLQSLVGEYSGGKIDKREGYQRLSFLIRTFVHEITGINVENYTKSEIKTLGMPQLDRLMEEYYVPEFAEEEKSLDKNFLESCNRAMGVIGTWK